MNFETHFILLLYLLCILYVLVIIQKHSNVVIRAHLAQYQEVLHSNGTTSVNIMLEQVWYALYKVQDGDHTTLYEHPGNALKIQDSMHKDCQTHTIHADPIHLGANRIKYLIWSTSSDTNKHCDAEYLYDSECQFKGLVWMFTCWQECCFTYTTPLHRGMSQGHCSEWYDYGVHISYQAYLSNGMRGREGESA